MIKEKRLNTIKELYEGDSYIWTESDNLYTDNCFDLPVNGVLKYNKKKYSFKFYLNTKCYDFLSDLQYYYNLDFSALDDDLYVILDGKKYKLDNEDTLLQNFDEKENLKKELISNQKIVFVV